MTKIEEPAPEGFLYRLWAENGFGGRHLRTLDGQTVELSSRGVRNYDAGPDFLDAVIAFNGQTKRGDIEIHPVAGDWYSHNHHQDPRYNRVILHVVTMDCPPDFRTVRQNGQTVPTLNLDQFLDTPSEEMAQTTLELELPRHKRTGVCALAQKDGSWIQRTLEHYGDQRLAMKTDRLTEQRTTESWDQLFHLSLLESLGYSKNQIPFRRLAKILPVETLWNYLWKDNFELAILKCEAVLFGAAGLLPSQDTSGRKIIAEENVWGYIQELEKTWGVFPEKRKIDPLPLESWQFFRLRPQNFPTRRIAAAARLVLRFLEKGYIDDFAQMVVALERKSAKVREFAKRFIVDADGFWRDHFCFDESIIEIKPYDTGRLVGMERATDIVVNVALPALLAYSTETEDGHLRNSVLEMYAQHPILSENTITKTMRQMLFDDENGGGDWVVGVRHQQGLIQLHKFECVPEDCAKCVVS